MTDDLTQRMIDAVAESQDLESAEKETAISFDKTTDKARLTTREAGIMRRLLQLEEFEVRWIMQESSEGPVKIEANDLAEEFDGRRRLVSIHGLIPVGSMKISPGVRSSGGHANIVSTP